MRGGRSHGLGGCREADRREKMGREGEEFCESSPMEEGRVRGKNWEEMGGGRGRLHGEE